MSDYVVSLIRTYVPVGVGLAAAWLIAHGVPVDTATKTGMVTALSGVLIAGYYAIVRKLEQRWPIVGRLLGKSAQPVYPAADGARRDG